jgi:hypothetical protein
MYGYGYRYNNGLVVNGGTPPPPPFVNTYSLSFDGMDDYVSTNSKIIGSDITLSGWVNFNGSYSSFSEHFPMSITPSNTSAPNETLGRFYKNGSKLQIAIQCFDNTGANFSTYYVDNTTLEGAGWQHICLTYNVTTKHIYAYLNGVAQNWVKIFGASTPVPFLTAVSTRVYESDLTIGRVKPTTTTGTYLGLVDEVSTYNRILTQEEITSISAAPTDLTSLSPVAWYRMGDNGAYKSPQWLIPNNENKDKASNYSYEFDGTLSRQIDVGTVNVGTTNITSMWLKRSAVSTQQTLLGGSSLVFPDYHMLLFTSNDFYVRYSSAVVIGWTQTAVKAAFNNTTDWINIVVVRSGDTVKLHLNGDNVGISPNYSSGGAIGALDTKFTDIGADINGANPTFGTVNNLATWNVDSVLPSEIYNGGTPPDLTTLSTAPVNWWKMADDATFIYNTGSTSGVWTIPDNLGANDGTSTGTIFNRVGIAPNSENNGVSINMDLVDRELDTP